MKNVEVSLQIPQELHEKLTHIAEETTGDPGNVHETILAMVRHGIDEREDAKRIRGRIGFTDL